METIEMQLPFNTTLDEGIKMLRQKAEQTECESLLNSTASS